MSLYRLHVTIRLVLGLRGTTQGQRQSGLGLKRARLPPISILPPPESTTISAHPPLSFPSLIPIMAEQLVLRGTLEGHNGWVTSLGYLSGEVR